jgi:glycosyltransferase involved in cell wall biosynthesis
LVSKKVIVVGHGIDILKFSPMAHENNGVYTIISVGRISKTKKQYDMVLTAKILKDQGFRGRLILVGGTITEADFVYEKKIKEYIVDNKLEDYVILTGPISPNDITLWYEKADMFINLSETGSMDKAILEAMASGLEIVTSNEAFKNILPTDNFLGENDVDINKIAKKITFLSERAPDAKLREYIIKNHNLSTLLPKLIEIMEK